MSSAIQIRAIETPEERELAGLSDVLIDCVEGGASVSFVYPMSRAKADAFWNAAFESVARSERVVLAAVDQRPRQRGVSFGEGIHEPKVGGTCC